MKVKRFTHILFVLALVAGFGACSKGSSAPQGEDSGGGAPAEEIIPLDGSFAYESPVKLTIFDDVDGFTGASAVVSHTYSEGKGLVVLSGNVTAITDSKFSSDDEAKNNLTSLTLSQSVRTIGGGAFMNCKQLKTVLLAGYPTLQTIGVRAFYDCENLTSLSLPSTLTLIDEQAFQCPQMKSVIFKCNVDNLTWDGNGFPDDTQFYVPQADLPKWQAKYPGKNFNGSVFK